jgi:ketosteroid isomerase-like protein
LIKTALAILGLLTLAACTPDAAPMDTIATDTRNADMQAIRLVEESVRSAWAAKNSDGIMAQYAADAVRMSPGSGVALDLPQVRIAIAEVLKDPALSLEFASQKTDVTGDLGYQRGTYTMTYTDPRNQLPVRERGSYLSVFHRQPDGSWKVIEDIHTPGDPLLK